MQRLGLSHVEKIKLHPPCKANIEVITINQD
jgi:hypothetical protein